MLPVSQLISLLSPHHHPNTIPCELLLQCKVTDPIPRVIKILVLNRWALLAKIFESQLYRLLPIPSVPRHSFLLGGSSNEFLAQLGLMQEVLILEETLMPGGELLSGKNTWNIVVLNRILSSCVNKLKFNDFLFHILN